MGAACAAGASARTTPKTANHVTVLFILRLPVYGSSGVFERNVVLSIHVIEEDDGDIGGDRLDV